MAQIAGFGILSALCVFLLREFRSSGIAALSSALFALLLCGLLLQRAGALLQKGAPLLAECAELFPYFGKILGVAWLGQIGSDLCKELGAPSLSGYVEAIGKCEILLLTLPLLEKTLTAAEALFS